MSEMMDSSSNTALMKLSCVRCRSKKLKCDKTYPECFRCQAAGTACSFPSRKRRLRYEGGRNAPRHQAIAMRPQTADPDIIKRHGVTSVDSTSQLKDTRPDSNLLGNSESWVYNMVNGAKNNIEHLKLTGCLMSSGSTAGRPIIEKELTDLNHALSTLRERMPGSHQNLSAEPEYTASVEDLERHVNLFLQTVRYIPFDPFQPLLDIHVLKALPRLFASPYVQVDPAMQVVYYCAIFLGQCCGTPTEQSKIPKTYYRCIVMTRDWLKSATGTEMDLLAAMMLSWLAINNFDYHLSWTFHREACRFAATLGLHRVDLSLPSGRKDEEKKEEKRRIYWYLAQTDLTFRLWYDKPPCLEGCILDVRAPSVVRPTGAQLSAPETVLQVVWTRMIRILFEYFKRTDETDRSNESRNNIDSFCAQIEELLTDWDLLNTVRSMASDDLMTWFFAESVTACYCFIVFMRRKVSSTVHSVHPQAVHASRTIISIINDFSGPTISFSGAHRVFNLLFITFYPFCAFFTLYQRIITAPSLEECENDILSLEAVVREMTRLTSIRSDFVPITNVMDALNRISRVIHGSPKQVSGSAVPPENQPPKPGSSSRRGNMPSQQVAETGNLNPTVPATQQPAMENPKAFFGLPFEMAPDVGVPSLENSTTATMSDDNEPEGIYEPLDIVRAIEEELVWRNWHDNWWRMDGLGDLPTLGGSHDMSQTSQGN